MKPLSIIIFILITLHLSTACSTSEGYTKDESEEYVTVKHSFPNNLTRELIETEFNLGKTVEVRTKSSNTPIKLISVDNSDLLGTTSDGQEVKIDIADITEAWSSNTVAKSTHKTTGVNTYHRIDAHMTPLEKGFYKAVIVFGIILILAVL